MWTKKHTRGNLVNFRHGKPEIPTLKLQKFPGSKIKIVIGKCKACGKDWGIPVFRILFTGKG